MSLRTRLALGILAIALVLAIPLLVSLRSLEGLHDEATGLTNQEFAASLLLGRIRTATEDLRRSETGVVVAGDSGSRDAMLAQIDLLAALADSLSGYELDMEASHVRDAVRDLVSEARPQFEAAHAGRTDVVDSLSTYVMIPAMARIEQAIAAAERSLSHRTRQRIGRVATATEQAWEVSALMLMLATLLGSVIAFWLMRSISGPVLALDTGMRRVAGGDLDYRLPIRPDRSDEFGRLSVSFSAMITQLAALEKMKAEFMSVTSHELKTPLNVIIGYLQLLDEGIYGQLSAKQREICGTIRAQANGLARLVHQLLDVSRFEAGAGRIEPRTVQLGSFLEELDRAFAVLARQRGIAFRIALGDELPATVEWDADRMNEVLGNLLSNAFKFTDRGGRVELSVEREDGIIRIVVRDTGAGIPPEQLPHVFQKFYQADNQEQAAQAGSGLGLAIAKQIVEAHHGTIECDSAVGEGTTFTIMLPESASSPVRLPERTLEPTGAG